MYQEPSARQSAAIVPENLIGRPSVEHRQRRTATADLTQFIGKATSTSSLLSPFEPFPQRCHDCFCERGQLSR